jgi:hypothetical protein
MPLGIVSLNKLVGDDVVTADELNIAAMELLQLQYRHYCWMHDVLAHQILDLQESDHPLQLLIQLDEL